jgi:uncharacterized protein (DUF433 family)
MEHDASSKLLCAHAYTVEDLVGRLVHAAWVRYGDARSTGEKTLGAHIINRGRGPEIEGTRITVYDVLDDLQEGWRYDQIAGLFRLPPEDIQVAMAYIEAHKEEVRTAYRQILARHQHVQYAPEVQAKLARNRQKFQAKLAELRSRARAESDHADTHGGS